MLSPLFLYPLKQQGSADSQHTRKVRRIDSISSARNNSLVARASSSRSGGGASPGAGAGAGAGASGGAGAQCRLARSTVGSTAGWCNVGWSSLRASGVVLKGAGCIGGGAIRLSVYGSLSGDDPGGDGMKTHFSLMTITIPLWQCFPCAQ